jgi:hypothetical protein
MPLGAPLVEALEQLNRFAKEVMPAFRGAKVPALANPDGHRWHLPPKTRFAPDSPLEEAVTSEPVSEPKFPVMQGKYREFHRFEPRSPRSGVETAIIISALRANSLRSGTGN